MDMTLLVSPNHEVRMRVKVGYRTSVGRQRYYSFAFAELEMKPAKQENLLSRT